MQNENGKFPRKLSYWRKRKVVDHRIVHVGDIANEYDYNQIDQQTFPDNRIISSKYTAWNFLPKNLFSQFHRIANFYFLCVAVTELVIDSPVSPATSIAPLVFVVSITAIKQGYEDILRHRADKQVNNMPVRVLRCGKLQTIAAKEVHVGDIVQVLSGHDIPCDMVLLSAADPEGNCHITTANLDGETSLKTFTCLAETRHLQTVESFESFQSNIECQQPNADLYRFVGRANIYSETGAKVTRPLGPKNLLLRGSRLKNTPYLYGCAIYTGQESKISLNYSSCHTKFSRVERRMNTFLCVFLVMLISYSVLSVGLQFNFNRHLTDSIIWYLPPLRNPLANPRIAIEEFLSFMVLCNYLVPISMYVTVELQKFFGAKFFAIDHDMYDPMTNEPAMALTSDLNEELGQVEYLFTDKTGTLTENCMVFRRCSIDTVLYEECNSELCKTPLLAGLEPEPVGDFPPAVDAMLTALVLCHTVHLDTSHLEFSESGEQFDYQATSPDEKCLVEACRRFGIVYQGVRDDYTYVYFKGVLQRYKQHHHLEFDPQRRRMSVIVENPDGEIFLYCKGADSAIMNRVVDSGSHQLTTDHHLTQFAKHGLRTLVIACKKLTEDDFTKYDGLLRQAKNALENRDELLEEVYDLIENDLKLLGVTAIEDQLQDGVPETIKALRLAGIQVWVLTGDKEETAVNVSYAAGHFHPRMIEIRLTKIANKEQCEEALQTIKSTLKNCSKDEKRHALIIDGISLSFALDGHTHLMSQICRKVITVLCCRMSPLQKAKVVHMMKKSHHKPTTAAIGDGANDVSMIQEAHVGLGIFGKEGRQAALSSDYAFGRFRFLKRALLVHGHYFYSRIAILVQYFFYKNVAMITANFYFTFYSGYAGLSVLDGFYLMFYNITFCSLPIMLYGVFEQNMCQKDLLHYPELYRYIRRNAKMSIGQFLKWTLLGLWHSIVFFYGTQLAFHSTVSQRNDGLMFDVYEYGTVLITTCTFTVNIKLMIETKFWCWVTLLGYAITGSGFFFLCIVYSVYPWPAIMTDDNALYGSILNLYSTPNFWFTVMVLVVIALIPDIVLETVNGTLNSLHQQEHLTKQCSTYDHHNKLAISFTKRSGTLTLSQMNMIDS